MTLKIFVDSIIAKLRAVSKKYHRSEVLHDDTRYKIATQEKRFLSYVIVYIKEAYAGDSKTLLTSEELIQGRKARELAGLISWMDKWQEFSEGYVKYLVGNPISTMSRDSLILIKFPGCLIFLPEPIPEGTVELYLMTIELSRMQTQSLRIYDAILDEQIETLIHITKGLSSCEVRYGKNLLETMEKIENLLWNANVTKAEIINKTEDVRRTREMLPLHRLLWVFDEVSKETMVSREYELLNWRLEALDKCIKDYYSLFNILQTRREQEELTRLQLIFVIGVIAQVIPLFFISMASYSGYFGWWLAISTFVCGYVIFKIFRMCWRRSQKIA